MIDLGTPNFTFEELTACPHGGAMAARQTALAKHPDTLAAIQCLAILLQHVRSHFGAPITVQPGYRYAEEIEGKWYGYDVRAQGKAQGSTGYRPKSQHTRGEAADFDVQGVRHDEVFRWIADECMHPFGQVINETRGSSRWIHLSIPGTAYSGRWIEGECLSFVAHRDPRYRHERDKMIARRRWTP
jgi:zinc D-Ala-D-Ala carboxypeptidase